jgi:steroid delta-isomerase
MPNNPIQAVHAYMAAINAIDPDAYAACFAEGAELHDPVGAPPLVGPEGARAFMGQFAPLIESIYIRAGKIHVAGESAVFTWALEATGKNGRMAAADGIDVMVFNGEGKLLRLHGYWDAAPFIAALTA